MKIEYDAYTCPAFLKRRILPKRLAEGRAGHFALVLRAELTSSRFSQLTSGDFDLMAGLTSYYAAQVIVLVRARYDAGVRAGLDFLRHGPRALGFGLKRAFYDMKGRVARCAIPALVVLRRGLPCAVGPGYPLARLRPRRAGLRFTGKFSSGGWRC